MKTKINDLLLKMQNGKNCIGETANQLLDLFSVSGSVTPFGEAKETLHIDGVVCIYSPFPQSLKAGKKYKILANYKNKVAIIDETNELAIYNKCYFGLQ